MLSACPGEKKNQNEPKAKGDHLYKSQFDAIEKAKKTEKELQEAYSKQLKGIEDQGQ